MNAKIFFSFLILICCLASCQSVSKLLNRSGTMLLVEVQSEDEEATDHSSAIIISRLNHFGVTADVKRITPHRIEIKIFGEQDIPRLKNLLLETGKFELKKVIVNSGSNDPLIFPSKEAAMQFDGGKTSDNSTLLRYNELAGNDVEKWIFVTNPPIINNGDLAEVYPKGNQDGTYQINFKLKPEAGQKFAEWTSRNIGSYVAIILNDEVKSAPVIKGAISDNGQIQGKFTKAAADDLSIVMQNGEMPARLELISEQKFGN